MYPIIANKKTEIKHEMPFAGKEFDLQRKIRGFGRVDFYQALCAEPNLPTNQIKYRLQISLSVSQLNRIRKKWGFSRKRGRPRNDKVKASNPGQIYQYAPKSGLMLFQMWMEEKQQHEVVLTRIQDLIVNYRRENPEKNLRLLRSKAETIAKKWRAMAVAPLLGIKKFSELDYKPHNMRSVLGYSYRNSTLRQFLAELEQIGGQHLKDILFEVATGKYCYIDGHMIAFWTRSKMHKGLITMLGRVMPGSKAVLAHDQSGNAIGLEYYPPDIHLNKVIEDYCSAIEESIGIKQFIIDREVNSVEIARMFVERGWELICLLDSNQYKGPESFHKNFSGRLDDGTVLYKARWKHYHENDPRVFIIAKESERFLVYWTTPNLAKRLTAAEIIKLYRKRNELQEHNIKHMICHGALNTNYGIKKIMGPDRTHQRKVEKINEKITKIRGKEEKLKQSLITQQGKIEQSISRNHGKLLLKRREKLSVLQQQQNEISEKISAQREEIQKLGEPSPRGDRDFRKQTIMTFRTLWLENMLKIFISLISKKLNQAVDIEVILDLFFNRPAIIKENNGNLLLCLDTKDLSSRYKQILGQLADAFNDIRFCYRKRQVLVERTGFS